MKPSEENELIIWMNACFEEKDVVPILNHFIENKIPKHEFIILIVNSIPSYKKWFTAVNLFTDYEKMTIEEKESANQLFFDFVDERLNRERAF